MGIIAKIIEKLKQFFSDLKRNRELLVIITIIWLMLLFGILFLKIYVGPLQPISSLPGILEQLWPGHGQLLSNLFTSIIQVMLAVSYVGIWLYLWYRMIRMYFWRTIKKFYPTPEN
ncbi:MAG: hypothetical protein ACTSQQ_16730, partial [Candidatus Helarchaeota archaeon]